jgi:hypothetical protein
MKRKLFLIVIILTICSALFAKDKILFNKETDYSALTLHFYEDRFYIQVVERVPEQDIVDVFLINCDDEDKINDLLFHLLDHNLQGLYGPTIEYLEATRTQLTLTKQSKKIVRNIPMIEKIYELK